jgi:cation:H+ antiporter
MPSEPHWFLILVYLGAGFLLLTKGADWLVGSSSQVARRMGISTLVVGLTIVAFGTSAPEIVVSSFAAAEGKVDLSLGNVLGSNIANIGLVLGLCAIVLPKVLEVRLPLREVFWVFLSLASLWWVAHDHVISRMEASFLLAISVVFLIHLWLTSKEGGHVVEAAGEYRRPGVWIVIGIAAICLGAKLVVMGAEDGALMIGIPASVVGLTVVAVGTSLPELAAGLGGAFKGETDLSLGNVVGSNVFNLVAVIGIAALVQPFDPDNPGIADKEALDSAFTQALNEDFFVVLAFSLAAILLPRIAPGSGRAKGALLLFAYALYTLWLFKSRAL